MLTHQPIILSEAERAELEAVLHRGTASARVRTRAEVLLKASAGWTDAQILDAFAASRETVGRVRARFAAGGLPGGLRDRRQTRRRQALRGEQAAHLVALACTTAPDGHDHWTLRLLAGKAVELGFVAGLSPETVRTLLKKTNASPGGMCSGASRS